MQLICVDELGRPVKGAAEYHFVIDGEDARTSLLGDDDGCFEIASISGTLPNYALIRSFQGHWNLGITNPREDKKPHLLNSITVPDAFLWWRKAIGRDMSEPQAGKGVRIGVIDLAFAPSGTLGHVQVFDVNGNRLDPSSLPTASHGHRVCRFIGERGQQMWQEGVATGSEVILVDVSEDEDPTQWDYTKIGAAILTLVKHHHVDIVNISGGAYRKSVDDAGTPYAVIEDKVQYAASKGVVVFAAVGNNSSNRPASPACLPDVIGVGAVGLDGVAPENSRFGKSRLAAEDEEGGISPPDSPERYFHCVSTCSGEGLNAVGPGIGLFLQFEEGDAVIEYEGTSFASPIAAAVLACALAKDRAYRHVFGVARSLYATDLFRNLCIDLGLHPLRQGWGLPTLKGGDAV
jgi:subtilisin family serine protease